ncbi:hypothetical protein EXIGLDRAFT_231296 [Exidia glandulosa HHB12029]|uniref:DUF6533 domain-containing protein n=1 Tax=Exidia glandulosa HHB12029 TaxID=1314781 RepID=A0A165E5I8_EXIGL|nr:hypothetical protein EXIGLDRAFT_231296 [Exidia glandulosa HHB12029]
MFRLLRFWRPFLSPLSSLFAFTGVGVTFMGIGLVFALRNDLHGFIAARTSFRVAALSWTVWDHLTSIDNEVTLVWMKPIRIGSILYFVTRYFGLLSQLLIVCLDHWVRVQNQDFGGIDTELTADAWLVRLAPLLQFFIFWVITVMMHMRVYALYGHSRKVALVNGSLFILQAATMVLLWLLWPIKCQATGRIYTRLDSSSASWQTFDELCSGGVPDSLLPFYWLPALTFGLVPTLQILCKLATGVSLVGVLAEDSIIHVFLVGVFMFMHIVMGFYGLATCAIPFVIASQTIGGSHFVLHLRSAYYAATDNEASSGTLRTPTIGFTSSPLFEESFYAPGPSTTASRPHLVSVRPAS